MQAVVQSRLDWRVTLRHFRSCDVRALHLYTSMHSPACRQWRQQYVYLFVKLFWADIEARHQAISSLKHRPAG